MLGLSPLAPKRTAVHGPESAGSPGARSPVLSTGGLTRQALRHTLRKIGWRTSLSMSHFCLACGCPVWSPPVHTPVDVPEKHTARSLFSKRCQ